MKAFKSGDTIFALASGRVRAGVAVIRVSGAQASKVVMEVTGRGVPRPREAVVRSIYEGAGHEGSGFEGSGYEPFGAAIDRGLVLWFPAPASFTGEDVAEFHVHGGLAVVDAVLARLGEIEGCRLAQPGEFSRRAVLNGKMDFTEAEGIADLIEAETRQQRRLAAEQAGGAIRAAASEWRQGLVAALAHYEAVIDFPDEDLPPAVEAQVAQSVKQVRNALAAAETAGARGERLRDGLSVVLIGEPNAGKSSLLNAIAGREVAIVTEEAGTTRDVLEVHLDLDGFPVILADTAGIRETESIAEGAGVARALARAEAADVRLYVVDGSAAFPARLSVSEGGSDIVVATKADLWAGAEPAWAASLSGRDSIGVSVELGQGLDGLIEALSRQAAARLSVGEGVHLTRRRHVEVVGQVIEELDHFLAGGLLPVELRAEHLRAALGALGRLTGETDVEDLLDVVFRDFCLGK